MNCIENSIIEMMINEGYIDEQAHRNFVIRKRYKQLRDERKRVEQCLEILSKEFFISPETVRHVIYKAKK